MFESNPGDELDFVSEEIVFETQRDGEGPSPVAHVQPRRRANTSSSGVPARCRGRSFLLALVVARLVVLLALLVLCVVVAYRELAALGGRVVALEAGGLFTRPEVDGAAASDIGFRRCSECATGFSCDFVFFMDSDAVCGHFLLEKHILAGLNFYIYIYIYI